jgi:peptide/nickel transport system substrate-binding protein
MTRSIHPNGRSALGALLAIVAVAAALAACGSGSGTAGGSPSAPGAPSGPPKHGGSVTVLVPPPMGTEVASLDPTSVSGGIIYSGYLSPIFGQLFWIGNNGKIVPGLASGYTFTDGGKTLTIQLRQGVQFSDGTPLDAQAVLWNFRRDIAEGRKGCNCVPQLLYDKRTKISTPDDHTVVLQFPTPLAVGIPRFSHYMWNYIVSPTAYQKMGAKKFREAPVGAGPFVVESFSPNDKVVLKRNPTYWKKGHPYLDRLTFQSVQDAQSEFQAMEAGQGDVAINMTADNLVDSFKQRGFRLYAHNSPGVESLTMNMLAPPFKDNIKAREVLYYATDPAFLNKQLYHNRNVLTQSFMAPGARFAMPKVPGYRTYDLDKAKALVKELGGLSVTLGYLASPATNTLAKALQTEWQESGMKVKLDPQNTSQYFKAISGPTFQVYLNLVGSYDPGTASMPAYFSSTGNYPIVHDPELTKLIADGVATNDQSERASIYHKIAKMVSDKAYAPFLWSGTSYTASRKSVTGPGISTPVPATVVVPLIWWQDVSVRE